jgi:hypothetical protein
MDELDAELAAPRSARRESRPRPASMIRAVLDTNAIDVAA